MIEHQIEHQSSIQRQSLIHVSARRLSHFTSITDDQRTWIFTYSNLTKSTNWSELRLCRRRRTALSVSCPCLVFVQIFRKMVSGVCPSGFCLSRFCQLSGFCQSLRNKTVRRLSVCPAGQGRERAVRTFTALVRWRLGLCISEKFHFFKSSV